MTYDHESAAAAEFPGTHDIVLWLQTGPAKPHRSCNLHRDCDKADETARARGRDRADHCHDDECEGCFGK